MRVLLDTHTLLWWGLDDVRLSTIARDVISDGTNDVIVSVASIWEVAIKTTKQRLQLPEPVDGFVDKRLRRNRWTALPIHAAHSTRAGSLPKIHGDPFDRILIAQSQIEDLPILTTDPAIMRYDVETIW
jgi:PIN domain nuclease of toxin-antitoxin system